MASYKELFDANEALRRVLKAGAEARLRTIPGVRHVSVGLKVQNGKVTRDLCIRVYVRAKRPESQLQPAERIPKFIDGVPTDVNVTRKPQFTSDSTRYRPLKGGSMSATTSWC
jgi:hypothetical protein